MMIQVQQSWKPFLNIWVTAASSDRGTAQGNSVGSQLFSLFFKYCAHYIVITVKYCPILVT